MERFERSEGERAAQMEVRGRAVRSILRGAGQFSVADRDRVESLLAENGIVRPRPDDWFSFDAYAAALTSIEESLTARTLHRIGLEIPKVIDWPTGVGDVASAMKYLDERHRRVHRSGDAGFYDFERTGTSEGRVECWTPYPCLLDEGIVEDTARKFSPRDDFVNLSESDRCREINADSCTYVIEW